MTYVYVASWRNPMQQGVVATLREAVEQLAEKDAEIERLKARIVVWIADDGEAELYA